MSVRLKWISLWLVFGFVMLAVFIASHQYLLKSTMLYYADQRDIQRLERLVGNLEFLLQQQGLTSINDFDPFYWRPLIQTSRRTDLSQFERPIEEHLIRNKGRSNSNNPNQAFSFENRVSLLDNQGNLKQGTIQKKYDLILPVKIDHQIVAQLGYMSSTIVNAQADLELAEMQKKAVLISTLVIALIGLILLWPVNYLLIMPIKTLATGLTSLASGKYKHRLNVKTSDEWGQLSQHFNHLALTLEQAKKSRSQWVASTSHELRTPVTVLRSSIESMLEGVRPVNEQNLTRLHDEVILLNRLIDDLYQLSLHDVGSLNYQMDYLDLGTLVNQVAQTHQPKIDNKGLVLRLKLASNIPPIFGDKKRLIQLFNNLVLNAIAYTDATQQNGQAGQILIKLTADNHNVFFEISDSPPAVSEEELSHLTDYLYRAASSRNRQSGGSGLGLTICQKIAQSHQAHLTFSASELGGLRVRLTFPFKGGIT
ncbi:ATP-binding protein [Thiomicrospira sp. R3]|uniref:ATP-binding protein n=1 Tax=Thiomicrospira sp. R3 TaxID=3035472 RepID=UPI00259B49EE|nr:ATP-binding protein [Thiomicrospira sp. R3]WFE69226.1 ATP-binding protein [Thiomicrospira sp. R3]